MTTPQRTTLEATWPTHRPNPLFVVLRFPLFLLCLLILLSAPAHAQNAPSTGASIPAPMGTTISGIINTDTHWTMADSPVIVTDDVTVMNNATLTIDAGVVVKFNDWWDLSLIHI